MSDIEILKLAAKAAGIEVPEDGPWGGVDATFGAYRLNGDGSRFEFKWNPLADDGDALRLAADTRLRIDFNYHTGSDKQKGIGVWSPGDDSPYPPFWTMYGKKPDRDVRYTIVRAAAHVGRAMP